VGYDDGWTFLDYLLKKYQQRRTPPLPLNGEALLLIAD